MEFIGILGTLFIVVAFMFTGEFRIRVFDAIGSVLFVIYGVTIQSFSTVLLNCVLIIVQAVHIYRLLKEE